jgi:hypothetical protein
VFVETPPQAATATPVRTLPPTDTFDNGGHQSNPGFSLMFLLLAIGGFVLAVGFITRCRSESADGIAAVTARPTDAAGG